MTLRVKNDEKKTDKEIAAMSGDIWNMSRTFESYGWTSEQKQEKVQQP